MIKYEVYKEETVETNKNNHIWFPTDMMDAYTLMDNDMMIVKSFNNLEEATNFFEAEKENCYSGYQDSYCSTLVLFDVIQLCEVEYDEGNELQKIDTIDEYIAPIYHSINDVIGYVMSHACRYDKPEKVKEFITKTFNNIDDVDLAEVMEELNDHFFED